MPSPMIRREQQINNIRKLVNQVYDKMSIHDRTVFVLALAEALALKMSPASRDEWIKRMQKKIAAPSAMTRPARQNETNEADDDQMLL